MLDVEFVKKTTEKVFAERQIRQEKMLLTIEMEFDHVVKMALLGGAPTALVTLNHLFVDGERIPDVYRESGSRAVVKKYQEKFPTMKMEISHLVKPDMPKHLGVSCETQIFVNLR